MILETTRHQGKSAPLRPMILCIDDDRRVLKATSLLLTQQGFCVLATESPLAALDMLTHHTIDVIVVDYEMPHINGGYFADRVKASGCRVPIVMRSACTVLPELSLRSVDAFISKLESSGKFLGLLDSLCAVHLGDRHRLNTETSASWTFTESRPRISNATSTH